jgi:hypothetical protein
MCTIRFGLPGPRAHVWYAVVSGESEAVPIAQASPLPRLPGAREGARPRVLSLWPRKRGRGKKGL